MEKYKFDKSVISLIEKSRIPFAVYQFIDGNPAAIALSGGFCILFGYERDEAYDLMNRDMYKGIHPDDTANPFRTAQSPAVRFFFIWIVLQSVRCFKCFLSHLRVTVQRYKNMLMLA